VVSQGNCSSTYVLVATSTVADRICQQVKKPVRLSAQEIITCDRANYHCDGGYVTRALNWGKRKGYILDECLPYNATKGTCDIDDHFENNECRKNQ